jgi:hypothetical protein
MPKLKSFVRRTEAGAETEAAWFETRGIAALLTMRIPDLILRRTHSGRLEG